VAHLLVRTGARLTGHRLVLWLIVIFLLLVLIALLHPDSTTHQVFRGTA